MKIIERLHDKGTDGIFGYMYGSPYICVATDGGAPFYKPDKLLFINKQKLILGKNRDCFVFRWGWHGPDINIYQFKDYGVTWAFDKSDIINITEWLMRY